MLLLEIYVFFRTRVPDTNKNGPGDPTFQNTSLTVSSEFCFQNSFKATDLDDATSQNTQAKT